MNRKEQNKIIQKKLDEKVALLEVKQPKLEIPIEEEPVSEGNLPVGLRRK